MKEICIWRNRRMEDKNEHDLRTQLRSSYGLRDAHFSPYPYYANPPTRVCYRDSSDFASIYSRSGFLQSPSLWLLFSFHFTELELLMYQATRIDGSTKPLRRKYSARRSFHENETGSASRFNNRGPVLCLECHIREPTTSMRTRFETIRLWPRRRTASFTRKLASLRDAPENSSAINGRAVD